MMQSTHEHKDRKKLLIILYVTYKKGSKMKRMLVLSLLLVQVDIAAGKKPMKNSNTEEELNHQLALIGRLPAHLTTQKDRQDLERTLKKLQAKNAFILAQQHSQLKATPHEETTTWLGALSSVFRLSYFTGK
jgi:hypothetical protein